MIDFAPLINHFLFHAANMQFKNEKNKQLKSDKI